MSELLALGVSHKTAPVALRERLALTPRASDELLRELVAPDVIDEAVAISTCNRTEIYLVAGDPVARRDRAARARSPPTPASARPSCADVVYSPRNCDAARQLYRVTSGLESMIVGEAEVQGQVKRAYEAALAAGTTGPLTNRLFTAALQTGKRVRTETGLGRAQISVSTVAVVARPRRARRPRRPHVVIIGAGETAELTAQALAEHGVSTIFVANRHADRARSLAERFGGTVVLARRPARRLLEHADIVVSSTSSPHPIIEAEELAPSCAPATAGRCADRHRRAARHRAGLPPARGRHAATTSTTCRPSSRATSRSARPSAATPRRSSRRRSSASPTGWASSTCCRRSPRCASTGPAIVDQVLAENAGRWEGASPRDRARVEAVARVGHAAPAARADDPPEARAAATAACRSCASCSASTTSPRADAQGDGRRPAADAPPARGVRIGTRGSALALAQARQAVALLPGEHELVEIVTTGDRGRCARQDKERWVARARRRAARRATSTSRCTRPRTCPPSCPTASSSPPCRRAPTRATRSAAPRRSSALAEGARVGTASLRRAAQLRALRARPRGRRAARQRRHAPAQARRRRRRRDRARRRRPGAARPRRRGRAAGRARARLRARAASR